jgi:hypothetical protein
VARGDVEGWSWLLEERFAMERKKFVVVILDIEVVVLEIHGEAEVMAAEEEKDDNVRKNLGRRVVFSPRLAFDFCLINA